MFRKKATDYSSGKLKGDVLAKPRVAHTWFSIVAFLWVVALCYAMANFSYREPIIIEAEAFTKNGSVMAAVYIESESLNKNISDEFIPARIKGGNDEWTHDLRLIKPLVSEVTKSQVASHESPLLQKNKLPANIFVNPDSERGRAIRDGDILEVKIDEIEVSLIDALFKRDTFK